MKCHKYRERYNVRHNGGQIGNHQWASDWHHDLILNCPSSRSSKLHIKYLKNGGHRYDVVVSRNLIGYRPWATIGNMNFDLG